MGRPPAPRWVFVLPALASLLTVTPSTGTGQQSLVVVGHTGSDTLAVLPGDRGSIPFRISNRSPAELRLGLNLVSPGDWRVVGPAGELAITSGETATRVVSFFIPPAAPAGVYAFVLTARTPGGAGAVDRVLVRVSESPELTVEVEAVPTWAVAGAPYTVTGRVRNAGNVPLVYRLRLESPHGFVATADTTAHRIDSGGSAAFRVVVTPPATVARALIHPLRILAVAPEDTAEAVARVEVVPHGRQTAVARAGVPAEVRLRASTDSRGGSPLRLYAAGPIGGSSTRMEALLQGPEQGYSIFGEADVYRLRLESPHYSLKLGDDVYFLSQLTEPGREGLGIGVSGRAGPLDAGAFLLRDRRTVRPDTQYAAFAGISPVRPLELRMNWLRRDSDRGRREVVSAEGTLRVPRWFVLRGEYGSRPSTAAAAVSASLAASRGPVAINLAHLRGDTAFGGTYAGLSTSSGQIGLRPWRVLYFEGSMEEQSFERPGFLLPFGSTHRSSRVAAGWGSRFSLEKRWLDRDLRGELATSGRSAESLRVRVSVPVGPLQLYPSYERGIGEEQGSAEPEPFWHATLRSDLRLGRATLSSNLEYFTGGTLHHSVLEEGVAGTAAAALRIGPSTEVHLSAYGTSYFRPLERRNVTVNASLEQRLPGGHRLGLRVFSRGSYGLIDHQETIALLDYSIPLKLPLGRQAPGTSISGHLFDAETGAPLSRVVVRVGDRRIATDARGRLTVAGIEPGIHYVDLDRATAGLGMTTAVPLPLRIDVVRGARSEFEIGLTRSATLTVRTRVARAVSLARPGERSNPEPLPRVVLELHRNGERLRRQTNPAGEVELRDLRPGRWTITVADAPLPAFHTFHSDSIVVDLEPGQSREVELVAAPIERRIEIIAGGELAAGADSLPVGWTTHRVAENTTLRQVAERVYGDPELWRQVWEANRTAVPDPDSVPIGILLRIPPVDPDRNR